MQGKRFKTAFKLLKQILLFLRSNKIQSNGKKALKLWQLCSSEWNQMWGKIYIQELVFLFKHCIKQSSATLKKVNLAQCHSGVFSNLNWKSNLIYARAVIRVQNIFISGSPIHAQHSHNPAEYFKQLFTRYPSTRLLGHVVRLPFHPVVADGPGTDNAGWQVDGIINNDFHPLWNERHLSASRGQAQQARMLTLREGDLWPFFTSMECRCCGEKKRGWLNHTNNPDANWQYCYSNGRRPSPSTHTVCVLPCCLEWVQRWRELQDCIISPVIFMCSTFTDHYAATT